MWFGRDNGGLFSCRNLVWKGPKRLEEVAQKIGRKARELGCLVSRQTLYCLSRRPLTARVGMVSDAQTHSGEQAESLPL